METVERNIRENNVVEFLKNNIDDLGDQINPARGDLKENAYHYLKLCAFYGRKEIATIIFSYGYVYYNLNFLLRLAIVSNKMEMVKLFIEQGANVNLIDNYALKIACCNGLYEITKKLIDSGANVHASDNYPLQVAASNGYENIVRLLIDNGTNIHNNFDHALIWAHTNNHVNIVNLLVEKGADKNIIDNISGDNKYVLRFEVDETSYRIVRIFMDKQNNIINTNVVTYNE
jgi:ankyrin repeat protein